MEERPNYYAIIPANVRYDDELTANEKLFYGEITALTQKMGECWATNNYFSNLYHITPQSVSRCIKHLKEKGYIDLEIIYKENSKEIEKRIIRLPINTNVNTYKHNCLEGYKHKCYGGINIKVKENNTSINNTSINKKEIIKEKVFDNQEVNELFNEFLQMRKKMKAINNDKAIKLLINKLNNYDDETKKEMINNSIENSWKSVYPIKNPKRKELTEEDLKEIEQRYANK